MDNKASNYPDYMSESIKKEDKNMTCKDGYCFLPNSEGNKTIGNENINIFDPLQIKFQTKFLIHPLIHQHFLQNVLMFYGLQLS